MNRVLSGLILTILANNLMHCECSGDLDPADEKLDRLLNCLKRLKKQIKDDKEEIDGHLAELETEIKTYNSTPALNNLTSRIDDLDARFQLSVKNQNDKNEEFNKTFGLIFTQLEKIHNWIGNMSTPTTTTDAPVSAATWSCSMTLLILPFLILSAF